MRSTIQPGRTCQTHRRRSWTEVLRVELANLQSSASRVVCLVTVICVGCAGTVRPEDRDLPVCTGLSRLPSWDKVVGCSAEMGEVLFEVDGYQFVPRADALDVCQQYVGGRELVRFIMEGVREVPGGNSSYMTACIIAGPSAGSGRLCAGNHYSLATGRRIGFATRGFRTRSRDSYLLEHNLGAFRELAKRVGLCASAERLQDDPVRR